MDLPGTAETDCEKPLWTQPVTTGAEARRDFVGLRGAEAPLFHGAARSLSTHLPRVAIPLCYPRLSVCVSS
jgi:hypothetical protein